MVARTYHNLTTILSLRKDGRKREKRQDTGRDLHGHTAVGANEEKEQK